MNVIDIVRSDGCIVVNKTLVYKFGLQTAVLLSEFITEQMNKKMFGDLTEDGFFCYAQKDIEESTTLGFSQQRKIVNNLVERGILETKVEGLPAKKYYKINKNVLLDILNE